MNTMAKITEFKKAKHELEDTKKWAGLIGKRYKDGSSGVGHIVSVALFGGEGSPAIHYRDGGQGSQYHYMPASLKPYLEAAIKANFDILLKQALSRQTEDLKVLAEDTLDEYRNLMVDAGFDPEAK